MSHAPLIDEKVVEGAPRGQNDEEARILLLRLLPPHSPSRSEYVLNYFTVNLHKQIAGAWWKKKIMIQA